MGDESARLGPRGAGVVVAGLTLAADAGMLDLRDSVAALLETNFRASPELLRHVLEGRSGRFG